MIRLWIRFAAGVVVGFLCALSPGARYRYETERLGPYTITIRFDRLTGRVHQKMPASSSWDPVVERQSSHPHGHIIDPVAARHWPLAFSDD
jgi:hypothetical protein